MSAIFQHPDGHEINLTHGLLTVTNADCDDSVSVPIGPLGLRELGERLIALSECEFTECDCAEQAGYAIAHNALNAMLTSDSQAEHCSILKAAFIGLEQLAYHDRAAAGFAAALVNVLEVGLKNLPKGAE